MQSIPMLGLVALAAWEYHVWHGIVPVRRVPPKAVNGRLTAKRFHIPQQACTN
jgi:hypothetical protein